MALLRLNVLKISNNVRSIATSNKSFGPNNLTKVNQENGAKIITMVNPKKRNALSLQMMEDLIEDISFDDNDPSVRCVVLKAEGHVFSAGHDLKELMKPDMPTKVFASASNLMTALRKSPVPIIAAVNGLAAASGCQLVAACDIVICTEKSSFSTPGGNFGMFCSTPGVALVRVVPRQLANWMLYTGEPITAQQALQVGLVAKICGEDQLDTEISRLANSIKSKPKDVVALGKKFLNEQVEMDVSSAFRWGENIMVKNLEFANAKEGLASFAEKRKPNYK